MDYRDRYPDYRIAYDGGSTYTVVRRADGRAISDHSTVGEARAQAERKQMEDDTAETDAELERLLRDRRPRR